MQMLYFKFLHHFGTSKISFKHHTESSGNVSTGTQTRRFVIPNMAYGHIFSVHESVFDNVLRPAPYIF